jgi:hypothetical protein
VILRRGQQTRFAGMAFQAGDEVDVLRLADKSGVTARALPESVGGLSVDLVEPKRNARCGWRPGCTSYRNCPISHPIISISGTT